MIMEYYVKHPTIPREQLSGKTLLHWRHTAQGCTRQLGWITVTKPRRDGSYVLLLQPEPTPDSSGASSKAGKPITKDAHVAVPQAESLDQAAVARIRTAVPQDPYGMQYVLD